MQYNSEECKDLYIGETKQPLHRRMAQHRRASSSGQDSAIHLHLKETGHSFEDHNVHILDREDRWFERGVKEAIFVKRETPSLNRGGGLRFQLTSTYNAVLKSLPTCLHKHLRRVSIAVLLVLCPRYYAPDLACVSIAGIPLNVGGALCPDVIIFSDRTYT